MLILQTLFFPSVSYKLHHIYLLFKRLLIVYVSFTACRLLFYIFNLKQFATSSFGDIVQSFFAGIIFDTSAIVYMFGFFILLHVIPINASHSTKVYLVRDGKDTQINQLISFMNGDLWATNTETDVNIHYRGNSQNVGYLNHVAHLNIKVVIE